jgi:hypothetical protein
MVHPVCSSFVSNSTKAADGEKQFTVKSHQVMLPNQQVATLIDLGNLIDVAVNSDGTEIDDHQLKADTSSSTLDQTGVTLVNFGVSVSLQVTMTITLTVVLLPTHVTFIYKFCII